MKQNAYSYVIFGAIAKIPISKNSNETKFFNFFNIPAQKHGFFERTPEAGFLVTEARTFIAILTRTVNSAAPIQVLIVKSVMPLVLGFHQVSYGHFGEREPVC